MGGQNEAPRSFRAGDWVVLAETLGGRAWAVEDGSWESLELTGAVASGLQQGGAALRTLRGLGALNPPLGRLTEAAQGGEREALTVGGLLRRSGWDLLFLELTGQCNERCLHCYAESSPERREELSWDEVRAVIEAAAELEFGTVQLTGGDPLVSKTYLEAARLARERGIGRIEVYTNGLGLSDRVADALAEVGVDYSFSFFSHRPEVHDQITGTPGSQERTLLAIDRALRRGAAVRIGIISTVTNREDVPAAFQLLASRGVDPERIGIDEERGVGRGQFVGVGELVRKGVPERLGREVERGTPAQVSAHGATLPRGGKLCVSYRGDVLPCIFARQHRLGSIREQTLAAILNQPLGLALGAQPGPQVTLQTGLTCRDCREASRLLEAAGWGRPPGVGERLLLSTDTP